MWGGALATAGRRPWHEDCALSQARVQLPYSLHTAPRVAQLLIGLAIMAGAIALRVAMEPVEVEFSLEFP